MSTSNCVDAGDGTAAVCEEVVGQRGAQGTFNSLEEVEEGRGVLEHSGLSPCNRRRTNIRNNFLNHSRARICKRFKEPRNRFHGSVPPGWESIPGLLKRVHKCGLFFHQVKKELARNLYLRYRCATSNCLRKNRYRVPYSCRTGQVSEQQIRISFGFGTDKICIKKFLILAAQENALGKITL
jgi:hypothetical protein